MFALRVLDTDLYEKTIRLDRVLVKGVSLYPFFRETGEVKYLMLVLPQAPGVFMAPYVQWQVAVYFWGGVRLDITPERLRASALFQPEDLQGLFHYDPLWALEQERFKHYWARDIIKQTNCADEVRASLGREIRYLRFSRDLSCLKSFALRPRGLKVVDTIGADKVLASLAVEKRPGPKKESWVLDPVWQNCRTAPDS